jgi:cysteine synthase A
MIQLGIERDVVNSATRAATIKHFRERKLVLPTLGELAQPSRIAQDKRDALQKVDPDAADPLNLFRVHWFNGGDRRTIVDTPEHMVLPPELTGIETPIVVLFGNRFPMINAHKVLAAYGCLVPRLVSGQFHPVLNRAIWPSTGNYCRGGVAISRILDCRGVAVLPEGMSEERFAWLREWVREPDDIVRTIGTESNVKEIYDKCAELAADPTNTIFNQFCEFGNHLVHYHCTGQAFDSVYQSLKQTKPNLRLSAFVSATGSAGTIGTGDYLKDLHGTQIVAVEALECPTMFNNGFGEHNIQGIGDKHVPYVHNVMNTDAIVAISDVSCESLNVLCNTEIGQEHLASQRGISSEIIERLKDFGLSSFCNVLAAIEYAKVQKLGPDDAVFTVATDGAALYQTEIEKSKTKHFGGSFDAANAARVFDEHLLARTGEFVEVLTEKGRNRIFNLGYYTWVEQQGVEVKDFEARRSQAFWRDLRELLPIWDGRIAEFNAEVAG